MADFYLDGFTGTENSAERRAALAKSLEMPEDMSAKALLSAINLLGMQDSYLAFSEREEEK
jgi:hypothetical protein